MIRQVLRENSLPVSLAKAAEILHTNSPDDDAALDTALRAAAEFVEENTGRTLIETTFDIFLPRFRWYRCNDNQWGRYFSWYGSIHIPIKPVRDIESVKYIDVDGDEQTIDSANYSWSHSDDGALLRFHFDYSFPALNVNEINPVRIRVLAGYNDPSESGSSPTDYELVLPAQAEQAILLHAGHFFEHRESVSDKEMFAVENSAKMLIANLRIFR